MSEAYVLSFDLAGPLPAGVNEKKIVCYFLAASFFLLISASMALRRRGRAPAEDEAPVGWDLDLDDGEDQLEIAVDSDSAPPADEKGPLEELQLINSPPLCHSPSL